MSVVCDTGPIIALAKLDRLNWFGTFFGFVAIPEAVVRELSAKPSPESTRIAGAIGSLLRPIVAPVPPLTVLIRTRHLGPGEREAIALADLGRSLLILDDHQARRAARDLGLSVTGTVGLVLEAKARNLISNARAALVVMRDRGYWFSDRLIEHAAEMAGESSR